jgi:hypothetical protein
MNSSEQKLRINKLTPYLGKKVTLCYKNIIEKNREFSLVGFRELAFGEIRTAYKPSEDFGEYSSSLFGILVNDDTTIITIGIDIITNAIDTNKTIEYQFE